MSANLLVDLGQTCLMQDSLMIAALGGGGTLASGGQVAGLSGTVVGLSVDLLQANTFTNLFIGGVATVVSGPLVLAVQCSDTDVSGNYTDPTSGLGQLPTVFRSGGVVVLNSGGTGGTWGSFISGHAVLSGFMEAAGFQRPQRYARAIFLSGTAEASGNQYLGQLQVGFIAQYRTTGSGGGFAYTPGSGGAVNV